MVTQFAAAGVIITFRAEIAPGSAARLQRKQRFSNPAYLPLFSRSKLSAFVYQDSTPTTSLFSLSEWVSQWACVVYFLIFFAGAETPRRRKVWNVSLVITPPLWVCVRARWKTTRERHWGGVTRWKWRILGAHAPTLASFLPENNSAATLSLAEKRGYWVEIPWTRL